MTSTRQTKTNDKYKTNKNKNKKNTGQTGDKYKKGNTNTSGGRDLDLHKIHLSWSETKT